MSPHVSVGDKISFIAAAEGPPPGRHCHRNRNRDYGSIPTGSLFGIGTTGSPPVKVLEP